MKLIQRFHRLLLNLSQTTYRLLSVIAVCVVAAFGLNSSALAADRWYVDASVEDCDNDGDSWANAFKYLQDALSAADALDEI